MSAFLLRRLASTLPTLVGISILAFLILNLLPADPILAWSSEGHQPSAEALERLRAALRVDRGPLERYRDWSLGLLRGDLGRSLRDGRPVGRVVAEALPWTLLLNLCAVAVIYGIAVPFGLLGARSPGSPADRLGRGALLFLYAVPSFAAALLLQQLFAVRLRILPLQGVADPAGAPALAARALDLSRHLVLPTACLALSGWAFIARYSRAVFRSVLGREFLAVARAKGLSRWRALLHVAANTAVPFVTLLASIIPGLAGGSVIVEQVFSWPGVGRLFLASIQTRDYPVVMGLTLLSAALVLAAQLFVDLLYVLADPAIRGRLLEEA
ncbi:MAG: ABC transporter permease [Acidobacteria bacterium]|nr:ABC transporter permease [Acidobacteriota bacterium]